MHRQKPTRLHRAQCKKIGPNRYSGRLLLIGLPVLTSGTAAYAALAAEYLLGSPTLPPLPLEAMAESLLGSMLILLSGALILERWR